MLTIGIATHTDHDGLWMTLQVLRSFHPHVPVLVIDNAPRYTNRVHSAVVAVGGKYIHRPDLAGTSKSRDHLFRIAETPWLLVCDSHIIFEPGCIEKALEIANGSGNPHNLYQGPSVGDNAKTLLTHWRPAGPNLLWGEWDQDERARGEEPFEIPMCGLGLFMAHKDYWPGFHPLSQGFGGEEGYIHEIYRRWGGKALCVPQLKWKHLYRDPNVHTPYPSNKLDLARNLLIQHRELGIDATDDIRKHHAKDIPQEYWEAWVNKIGQLQPFGKLHPRTPKINVLGVWYSNNTAPIEVMRHSLESIRKAKDSSRHNVNVQTCSYAQVIANPFPWQEAKEKLNSHLGIIRQVRQCMEGAGGFEWDVICFLEHDVLYPPDYFDRIAHAFWANPEAEVVSNLDYIGLNETGWLMVKERHEPMHQLSMRRYVAERNLDRAEQDCLVQGWALLEPQGSRDKWVRLPATGKWPSVHINHKGGRFTSHGEVVFHPESGGRIDHEFWGNAGYYWVGEMKPCAGCNQNGLNGAADNRSVLAPQIPNYQEGDSLEQWYEKAKEAPSDCQQHLDYLRGMPDQFEGGARVAELSGWLKPVLVAFAAAKPKSLISYADGAKPEWGALSKLLGDSFRGVEGDSLEVSIEECDLLFVDTQHRAERVYQELSRHHAKVTSRIVLHCTETFGESGDDGVKGGGVLPGLRRFLREHPEWVVVEHFSHNHGLTILSKLKEDKGDLPGLIEQGINYSKAQWKWYTNGKPEVSEQVLKLRLDTCALCKFRVDNRCSKCGCPLDHDEGGRLAKAPRATEDCPFGFWSQAEQAGHPIIPLPMLPTELVEAK